MKKLIYLALIVLLLSACGGTEPQPQPTEPVDTTPPVADLVVRLEERSGDPIDLNASFTYYVNVKNNGSATAKGVKLVVVVPFPVTDVPKQCNVSNLTLECNLDEIEVGFSKGVLVSGKASQEGTVSISASVSASTKDPDPSNNTVKENLKVINPDTTPQPVADLEVNLEERSGDPLPSKNPFVYYVEVRNGGGSTAKNVKLTITVPFPVAEVPQGCSSNNLTLECDLGELAVGLSEGTLVSGTAAGAGVFSVSAAVSADTYDPNSSNNSRSESFEVLPTATEPDLSGQVVGWNADTATLSAVLYGAAAQASKVASGTIGAGGGLEVFLKSVSSDVLTELPACPNLTQSNPNARQNSFSALEVRQGEKVIGRVALASKQSVLSKGLQAAGDYYVQQTYVDAATTLTGSCALSGVVNVTFQYDLKLNRGWNDVTFKLLTVNEGKQTLSLTAGTPPGAGWFFAATP